MNFSTIFQSIKILTSDTSTIGGKVPPQHFFKGCYCGTLINNILSSCTMVFTWYFQEYHSTTMAYVQKHGSTFDMCVNSVVHNNSVSLVYGILRLPWSIYVGILYIKYFFKKTI